MPRPRHRYPPIEAVDPSEAAGPLCDAMRKNRPLVVRGGDAAFAKRWSPQALAARYGESPIDVEQADVVYVGERSYTRVPLTEILERAARGDRRLRWKGVDFLRHVPAMRRDLLASVAPNEALLPPLAHDLRRTMWVAPRGTMSSLHHDGDYDNVNLQVSGRKLFLLVPPPTHRSLYTYGSAESPINPFVADLSRYPRFSTAGAVEATLTPGDVLLVPKYWWHCVYTVEASVNLSTHFRSPEQPSAWRVLKGAPFGHRALTTLAAGMKRRGYHHLANAAREIWWAGYSRVVPRVAPDSRCELVDP